jgi:gas vesicle protein
MKSKRSKDSSRTSWQLAFLVGLALGGLTGAVAMYLLAPRAGEKTRAKLQKQGAKLRHQAAESIEDVATEVAAEASDKAHQFADSVQHGVGKLQHNAQELLDVGKK